MATIVCQGLQPCLESQIHDQPRTIRLKLSCFFDENRCHDVDEKKNSSTPAAAADDDEDDDGSHCWSFLQATSNNNGSKLETSNKETTTTTYVHPLDTRSKSALSEKSLGLCTENLGSETGTDIIEDSGGCGGGGIFSSPSENGGNVSPRREQQKCDVKKAIPQNFPPPLSTITGVASLRVRPQREDGRLIIKATKVTSTHCSVFQAERSHGRLRLSLFEAPDDDDEEDEIENDIAGEEEEEEEKQEGDVIEDDFEEENDGYYMGKEEDEEEEKEEEEEEEAVNGKNEDVGGEMGINKFQRLRRRCKEGELEKKGLLNWEALWVATS